MAETRNVPARADTTKAPSPQPRATELIGENGRTSISDAVVAKIVGIAAREVSGVHELVPQSFSESARGFAQRIVGSEGRAHGVSVEVGQREAAVDLAVVVDYGVRITLVTDGIRENIIHRVEEMTGLVVKEVNIYVTDLYFPDDDAQPEPPTRRVE